MWGKVKQELLRQSFLCLQLLQVPTVPSTTQVLPYTLPRAQCIHILITNIHRFLLLLFILSSDPAVHTFDASSLRLGLFGTMDGGVAGSHTNGTKGDETSQNREIKGHLLFEIATEVANRGKYCNDPLFQA